MSMKKIRKYLGELISKNEKSWYKPELFKADILSLIPTEIKIIELPPIEDKNYNCFIYILGLNYDENIVKDSKGFIYSSFIEKLVKEDKIKLVNKPSAGNIIFYRNPKKFKNVITHAGIIQKNGKVISKWSWGPTIKHKVFDVPDFYGDKISYSKSISKRKAREFYWQYKGFNKKN